MQNSFTKSNKGAFIVADTVLSEIDSRLLLLLDRFKLNAVLKVLLDALYLLLPHFEDPFVLFVENEECSLARLQWRYRNFLAVHGC